MEEGNSSQTAPTNSKSVLVLIALGVINMAVVVGVGLMIQKNKKKEAAEALAAQAGQPKQEVAAAPPSKPFVAKIVPVETMIINLLGNSGRRIVKINVELELEGDRAPQEIIEKKVQIRDRLIVILSDQSYEQIQSTEGKESLRELMRDNLNELLKDAIVKKVYFTDIIYN